MISRTVQNRIRYVCLGLVRASCLAGLLWLIAAVALRWQIRSAEDPLARLLLTFIGVAVGASVLEVINRVARIFPRSALAGFAGTVLSLVCYLLIVWTDLKTEAWLWRAWWISAIAAITASHIMLLRAAAAGRRGIVEKTAVVGAIGVALLLAGLVLRSNFLEPPPLAYAIVLGVLAPIVLAGSVIARVRVKRSQPRAPVPMWVKLGWRGGGLALLLLGSFYLGRITAPHPGLLDGNPGELASLPPEQVEAMVATDLKRLRALADGVDELFARSAALDAEVRAAQAAEGRTYYTPAEEDRIRSIFMSYLALRSGLLRMAAGYGSFESVREPALRDRCFLVGYGAATTVMDASLALVVQYRGDDAVRRKLNEPDVQWGIPAGMFEQIYAAVTGDRNVEAMEELGQYFLFHRAGWRERGLLPAETLDWLDTRFARAAARAQASGFDRRQAKLDRLIQRVREDAYSPYYAAQSVISTWIGDTRLVSREPFISADLIDATRERLQPGDIILERRNWFASNAFLPGFWPHAALYIGGIDDLARLGLVTSDGNGGWTSPHAAVRDALPRYLAPNADGHGHAIIESVSDGVVFNTLEHSLHADYAAVLRPRLDDEQKARAIERAFAHVGKPYDFEFDFFSADKLVCTELVYRAYAGSLDFELVRIMGRDTLPALEIARKFGRERNTPAQQLEFICFLDTRPGHRRATWADEQAFIASADRPGAFNE